MHFHAHLRRGEHHALSFYICSCCDAISFAKLFVEQFQQSNFQLIAFVWVPEQKKKKQ